LKTLLVLLALSLSVTSFAGDRDGRNDRDPRNGGGGRIDLRDGTTIVRIDIGDERETDSRAMMKRVANLERAVRELQNRVYDLEDDARPTTREVTVWTCSLPTSFDGTFVGKGKTETEARAAASNACTAKRSPFCSDFNIKKCEATKEIERI